jgi:hypothetical protein
VLATSLLLIVMDLMTRVTTLSNFRPSVGFVAYFVVWAFSIAGLWYLFAGKPVALALRLHRCVFYLVRLLYVSSVALSGWLGSGDLSGFSGYLLPLFLILAAGPEARLHYLSRWKRVILSVPEG